MPASCPPCRPLFIAEWGEPEPQTPEGIQFSLVQVEVAQEVEPECSARLHSDDRAGPHVRTGDEQRASADSEDSTGTPPKHEGRPWERQIVSGTAIEGNDE